MDGTLRYNRTRTTFPYEVEITRPENTDKMESLCWKGKGLDGKLSKQC